MSCDNLPGNGHMTRRLLLQFAETKDPAVARWIGDNVAFPNSMVDRITPAVTEQTRAFVRDTFGVDDRCPVVSESYLQWVLEDHFANGRPQLEEVGVHITDDVEPYEKLKVRLLNGSHSALSYVAYLMGFREVDAAMSDPTIRTFVKRYMDGDITPTVPRVPGIDVTAYKQTLIERFSNPAISDQVQRLAMDGSRKIPNSLVPPLEHQLSTGGSIEWLAFALAAWYRYLYGTDEAGAAIEITDPMRDELVARARNAPANPTALLSMQEIFGERVSTDTRLAAAVKQSLDAIRSLGTGQALGRLLRQ
jgi:mannitol 2-dehydrogenase